MRRTTTFHLLAVLILLLAVSLTTTRSSGEETHRWGDPYGYQETGNGLVDRPPNKRMGINFTSPDYDLRSWEWIQLQNVRWIRKQVPWYAADGEHDPGVLDVCRDDFAFHLAEARRVGSFLVPIVKSQHPDYTAFDPEIGTASKSFPPDDLGSWTDEYGYSYSYYSFIHDLVSRFQRELPILVIENEAHVLNMWSGNLNQYLKLVATAHLAAHRASPAIKVLDSGFASGALGDAITMDVFRGRFRLPAKHVFTAHKEGLNIDLSTVTGPDAALDFYNEYKRNFPEDFHFDNTTRLHYYLNKPRKLRNYSFITDFYKYVSDHVDGINVHFYEDPWLLEVLVDWIDYRFSLVDRVPPPLYCTEGGIRRKEPYEREGRENANDMVKQFMYVLSSRLQFYTWFSRDGEVRNQIGFLNDDRGSEESRRLASYTFEFLNNRIAEYAFDIFEEVPVNAEPDVRRFRMRRMEPGLPVLDVLWMDNGGYESGSTVVSVDAPYGATQCLEYDVDGSLVRRMTYHSEWTNIFLTAENPIIVEYHP